MTLSDVAWRATRPRQAPRRRRLPPQWQQEVVEPPLAVWDFHPPSGLCSAKCEHWAVAVAVAVVVVVMAAVKVMVTVQRRRAVCLGRVAWVVATGRHR